MDDDSLIDRIRQGDRRAFDEVVANLVGPLRDFAATITRSPDTARDVVQDVLLRVWERRAAWKPHGSVRAYLFGAVRNRALNAARDTAFRRATGADPAQDGPPSDADTAAEAEAREFAALVQRAIALLPERRREVYRLSRIYGLSYEEIAATLGVSLNTVRSHMTAALGHMRQSLAEYL